MQQQVAATSRSGMKSWRFVCTDCEFLWKSLAAQHHFVALTGHTKSNQTEFVQLVAAKKFCSEGSGFHLNSSVNTKRFVRAADSLPVYKE